MFATFDVVLVLVVVVVAIDFKYLREVAGKRNFGIASHIMDQFVVTRTQAHMPYARLNVSMICLWMWPQTAVELVTCSARDSCALQGF